MKSGIICLMVLVFFAFGLAQPAPIQAASGGDFSTKLTERMPGLLAKYRVPGAVVAYIQDGAVVWTQAYGLADRASQKPMSPDMVFNFGSCGKVLTGWGIMKLVEQGRIDLDAPVNQYLKRWQIQSDAYDPQQVTLRRLLSHTAGLTVHGFSDYSQRRSLPSLEEVLAGQNQLDGPVVLFQQPGKGNQYSGGGFVLLQMVIEDVTGEPFAQFIEREITTPLNAASLAWTWTPELSTRAPVPYGPQQEALGYRQLASQAIGSEIGTVADFARFVAAAVSGPNGEPPGRGVLMPETIAAMIQTQPNAGQTGLAYGVSRGMDGMILQHFGANPGWNAFFSLETSRREGLVMATNSSNGFPLNAAVQNLWVTTLYGLNEAAIEPPPEPETLSTQGMIMLGLAGLLTLGLVVSLAFFIRALRLKRRAWVSRPGWKGLPSVAVWSVLTLFWGYWFYTGLPLFFPPAFPDFWRTPQVDLVMAALMAWLAFSLARAWSTAVIDRRPSQG